MWRKILVLFGIFIAVIQVCNSVNITKMTVPSTYIIENSSSIANGQQLMLECEYDVNDNEQGLVLKWLLNNQQIYQWIPSRQPLGLSFFRNRINTTYKSSNKPLHMHRTLVVTRPHWNMTGNYSCSVQTFDSSDRRTAFLQIIVPESDFQLQYRTDYDGIVHIMCNAFDISPEPELVLALDSEIGMNYTIRTNQGKNGLYQTTVSIMIPQNDIKPESVINCKLSIPGTNYTKQRETIYYEQAPMSTESDVEDVSSGIFSLGIESQPNSAGSLPLMIHFNYILLFIIFPFINH